MLKLKDYGEFNFLKSSDEYKKELLDLYNEIGTDIATRTLIKDDWYLIKRMEELMIIISFLEGELIETKYDIKVEDNK